MPSSPQAAVPGHGAVSLHRTRQACSLSGRPQLSLPSQSSAFPDSTTPLPHTSRLTSSSSVQALAMTANAAAMRIACMFPRARTTRAIEAKTESSVAAVGCARALLERILDDGIGASPALPAPLRSALGTLLVLGGERDR